MSRRSSRHPTAGWRSVRSRSLTNRRGGNRVGNSLYRRLRLEPLEDRRLLAVVTVTTLDDTIDFNDGMTSLREAIFATNTVLGADTIEFAPDLTAEGPATILLTQGELSITDSLTIDGPGAELLTIDASGNDPTRDVNNGDGSRIFNVDDGIQPTLLEISISGLALTGGDIYRDLDAENMSGSYTLAGGAVFSSESLTLNGLIIVDNAAAYGGGVANTVGTLQIADSRIASNVANRFGGGVLSATTTIVNSVVEGNSARGGAGLSLNGKSSIRSSTIHANMALETGGGIRITVSPPMEITDSVISGNTARSGGGIADNYFSGLIIKGSTISGNHATRDGGGIVSRGYLALSGSEISANSAEVKGGGIRSSGVVKVVDSTISNNTAGSAGGIDGYNAAVTISNSIISDNTATTNLVGGVIGNSVTIVGSVIRGNSAVVDGGGVYVLRTGQILYSTISDNNAGRYGGGLFSGGSVTISRSQVDSNQASGSAGGGIFATGDVTLVESTVHDNYTAIIVGEVNTGGGGVYATGEVVVDRSTVSRNTSTYGGGVFSAIGVTARHSSFADNAARLNGDGIGTFGSVALDHTIVAGFSDVIGSPNAGTAVPVLAVFSLIGHGGGTSLAEAPVGAADDNGNVIGGPTAGFINARLGPLADHGGFELPDGTHILTHALLPGSPAINAGDLNAVAGEGSVAEFDQRGEPFGRVVGGRIDIGAFEYQTPTDINRLVDTLEDESDGDYSRGDLSLREAIELANASRYEGVIDTIRFDPALTVAGPATILLTQGELAITDSVTIDGPGAELLTIDASGNDPTPDENNGDGSRVFRVDDGNSTTLIDVSIENLKMSGGDVSDNGGAILSSERLSLQSSAVEGNAARANGGGISAAAAGAEGLIRINKTQVAGNEASVGGGAYFLAYDGGRIEFVESDAVENVAVGRRGVREVNAGGLYVDVRATSSGLIRGANISENQLMRSDIDSSGGGAVIRSSGTMLIEDSTIENNSSNGRTGGLHALGSSESPIVIRRTVIANNSTSGFGGGLATEYATIAESSIVGNQAGGVGGGVFASSGVDIIGSVVAGNTSLRDGGGIYHAGQLTISESRIERNSAVSRGGGVAGFGLGNADAQITRSVISENSAEFGGGVWLAYGSAIRQTTIHDNSATGGGGGVWVNAVGEILDSTISGNDAAVGGGVYSSQTVTVDLTRSTVAYNAASIAGGGIYVDGSEWGRFGIGHSIVSENSALSGPQVAALADVMLDAEYSLIRDNAGSGLSESPFGFSDEKGNLIGGPIHGPIDPLLGPLADNGGFKLPDGSHILTHALLPGSPAINAGDPAAVAGLGGVPLHDQRDVPFTRVFGGRIDMGAMESIPAGLLTGDYNGDGVVGAADYSVWRDSVGKGASSPGSGADGNGDGAVDALDYAVWKSSFGATAEQLGAGSLEQGSVIETSLLTSSGGGGRSTIEALHVELASEAPTLPDVRRRASARTGAIALAGRDHALAEWVARRDHDARTESPEMESEAIRAHADGKVGAIDQAVEEFGGASRDHGLSLGARRILASRR